MKLHTRLINNYIKKVNAKTYVEIGVQNAAANFDLIKCERKIGVDPDRSSGATHKMTSDQYFETGNAIVIADIYFIDGDHEAFQVERDLINASNLLSPKGVILVHDLNPKEEIEQRVPRESKVWTGNVWRTFVGLRQKYPLLKAYCYREDHGVGVIFPQGQVFEAPFVSDISFEEFMQNKRKLLNLI